MKKVLRGSTFEISWVASGTQPSAVTFNVLDSSESVVNTGTLVDSGNGQWYYAYTVPSSDGFYVAKTTAIFDGNPYRNAVPFRVIELEVD